MKFFFDHFTEMHQFNWSNPTNQEIKPTQTCTNIWAKESTELLQRKF